MTSFVEPHANPEGESGIRILFNWHSSKLTIKVPKSVKKIIEIYN